MSPNTNDTSMIFMAMVTPDAILAMRVPLSAVEAPFGILTCVTAADTASLAEPVVSVSLSSRWTCEKFDDNEWIVLAP